MNIPRQFYGMNYISRLVSNFQDGEMIDSPKLCFHEISDVEEKMLPRTDSFELGLSAVELSKLLHELVENRSCMLDGLAIAKDENMICVGYRPPYSKKNPHITNSTCKTITAIGVMFAISEGLLGVEDTVLSFFPEYETVLTSKYVKQMTVEHLLTMTSCSKSSELTAVVEADWVKAFLLTECHCEPGTQFIYNSMNTYMLSAILCKVTEMSLLEYLKPRLFEPLGINNISWELCPKGIERGGWGMHLSLEGMIKIGLFLAKDGYYGGKQLIEAHYIRQMKDTRVAQDVDALSTGYGYQLWHLPDGYYMLSGMYGQHVIINERHKLVIATNAHNDKMFPDSALTKIILGFFNKADLYQPNTKWKEKLSFKCFLKEFEFFCNGYVLPKENNLLSLFLCQNEQQKTIAKNIEDLRIICNDVHGKRLHIDHATFNLFPYMMRGMYQFPPFAITDLAFRVTGDFLEICFVKERMKRDKKRKTEPERMIIRAGFVEYVKQRIKIGSNEVLLAAKVYLSKDEDGNDVMQLDMIFPDSGFSRRIKFFILENKISIECMEYPDMKAIVEQVVYGETTLAGNAIDLTGKLPEGIKVMMEHKIEPRVYGIWK